MDKEYRYGVGAMIINSNNQVFVAQRLDVTSGFQMPQGGLDPNESLETCLFRELREEIGTDNCIIMQRIKQPLYYDFPKKINGSLYNGRYVGQAIYWFLVRFQGEDSEINIHTAHPEFSNWRWSNINTVVDNVIDFKKTIYQIVINQFKLLLA